MKLPEASGSLSLFSARDFLVVQVKLVALASRT
jgi:hypothetical protein